MILKGIGVSDGIGIGKTVILENDNFEVVKKEAKPNEEMVRLSNAVELLKSELGKKTKRAMEEQAEILKSHIDMLEDPVLLSEMNQFIEDMCCNGEYAAATVFDQYIKMFLTSGDSLLELRAADLKDLKNNLIATLLNKPLINISDLPAGTVLVMEELTTSIAAGMDPQKVSAIITKAGGKTSHMAIIARSIGVPAVVGIDVSQMEQDTMVIVDGEEGTLQLNPSEEQVEKSMEKQAVLKQKRLALEQYRGMESITKDGNRIELFANIGLELDMDYAVKADAEGVGLFRTEFLYMNRNAAPDEEEQFKIYKKAAVAFGNKPVIIRTLDIGGDKEIPYLELEKEENPFLGWRAIRYCLDREEIFTTQIRAILRASHFGCVKIMLPMISTLSELKRAKACINSVKSQLLEEDVAINTKIPLGIMIETPSAAILADQFAKEVDFFSIGTNDLTQYTLAVDRGNKKVADLYTAYNPAVMRLIYHTAQAALEQGIQCGVCGEAAGDRLLVRFLIGSGVNELSMTGNKLLEVRKMVRNCSYQELRVKVREGLKKLSDVEEAAVFLKSL